MAYCYILFSKKLNRYYIGSTRLNTDERLHLHLNKYYGNKKFTAKADDWVMFLQLDFDSITLARKAEVFIKKMKSRKFYEKLNSNIEFRKGFYDKINN